MSIAVKIEKLSKIYRLGEIGTGTISRDIHRWFVKMRGKEDPFLKIGEKDDRNVKGGDSVYSLKDINLEIQRGDRVGIIGKNGAGKSTLLKVLSRVTSPTAGRINIKGRVASLLEVGTGFHPELTGKENIYLNGAILGMRKREIDSKLDEIINFSGIERYIDTPVKRYSSGMYVRLAFAVAAHLESEILIIDEVLAVGDAEFQKKCLGKMSEISKGEGRTVLFVSHHMPSMKSLCNTGIYLKKGAIAYQGNMRDTIEKYFESTNKNAEFGLIHDNIDRYNTGGAKFINIEVLDSNNNSVSELYLNESIKIKLTLSAFMKISDALVDIQISSLDGIIITYSMNFLDGVGYFSFNEGVYDIWADIENNFQPGTYSISVGIHNSSYGTPTIDFVPNVMNFSVLKVTKNDHSQDYNFSFIYGYVRPKTRWVFRERSN